MWSLVISESILFGMQFACLTSDQLPFTKSVEFYLMSYYHNAFGPRYKNSFVVDFNTIKTVIQCGYHPKGLLSGTSLFDDRLFFAADSRGFRYLLFRIHYYIIPKIVWVRDLLKFSDVDTCCSRT